ncbi:hypothetical protein ACHAO9_003555 [Fusarium lateritium]
MPHLNKQQRLALGLSSQHNQQTDIVLSNTAEEASLTDSRFAVQQEAIDEVEAMVTNTGNKDKMAAMIETLTTKAEALAAKDASLEQQLAAQSAAFEARLAQLEYHHKFSETNQMMGNMDV